VTEIFSVTLKILETRVCPDSVRTRIFSVKEVNNIMTKADLIEVVAKKANLTAKASREAVVGVFGAITDALKKGDKVVVTGFGTFMIRSRKSRTGRNPQTGSPINIPARKTPGFTAGKALKKVVR
jgi:DNA-binding protein HU-beta